MILTGFFDEYNGDFLKQIEAMKMLHIDYMEIRFVDGKNISTLSLDEARKCKALLDENNFHVSSMGSPIGKIKIDDDFASHLELCEHVFKLANIFKCKNVRCFSFYCNDNDTDREEVINKLGKIYELAEKYNITLCLENEHGIYGESPEKNKDILDHFDGKIKCVFDAGNYVLDNYNPLNGYYLLKDYIEYFHIKDALYGTAIVPCGKGDGHIKEILNDYSIDHNHFFVSLEPHLQLFNGLNSLATRDFDNPYKYNTTEEAFVAAKDALIETIGNVKCYKCKNIILKDRVLDGYIYTQAGKIKEVSTELDSCTEFIDYSDKVIMPGFVELHTHGAANHPYINNTTTDVIEASNYHLSCGTTTIIPTVTAGEFDIMKKATLKCADAIKSKKILANCYGVHLEGPYLSKDQAGAQCPKFITKPLDKDYEDFINHYNNVINRWTFAPENDDEGRFSKYLNDFGIIGSIGHSNAKYQDVKVAVDNGANLVTHLYSCTSTVTRDHGFRSLGVIESTYLMDELYAELICDGKHLPKDLIKMIVKIKGVTHLTACTDSLEITGTDIKEGTMSGTDFIVEDGVCKLKTREAFAGSVATSDCLLRTLVNECDLSLSDASIMLSTTPAKLLKVNTGELRSNFDADFVVLNKDLKVENVYVLGKKVK